ncbi:hypothetical protein BH11ARM2_BH11ARM2_22690 [soil metagenome]
MNIPNTELDVFPISLGTGDIGTAIKGDDADRLFDLYAEAGGNFIDTAHCYSFWIAGGLGESERAVGDWLRHSGERDRTIISTKGGHPPMEGYPHVADFLSPESLANDVAESLDRLGTDHIDLYHLHRDDGTTPVDEIIDALNDLPVLRYFGASNWSIFRVAEANLYASRVGKRGFAVLQNQWSLATPNWTMADTDPTNRYVTEADRDWCAENEVAIHAYTATANGYFGGNPAQGGFANIANAARHKKVAELAAKLGKTPTQIALAWLMNQPGTVIPILGTKNPTHLTEALGAIGLELDEPICAWLRSV